MIVVDTNLLLPLWVGGPHHDVAGRVRAHDQRWAVPRLWRSEFRNALVGMTRARLLTREEALIIAHDAERTLESDEHSVVTDDVLALAFVSGCSAYDCEYVALAESLGVPLVTFDRQVLRAFPQRAVSPKMLLRD